MASSCPVEPMECDTSSPHLDPELAEQHKAAGNTAYKDHDYERARQCYSDAIHASPGCAMYYGNRSAALMMLHLWSLALDDCTRAIQLDEVYTKGYLRAAKCHLMLGNPSLSIDYYQKVLGFERGNKQALAEMEVSRNVLSGLERAEQEANKKEYRTAVYYLDCCLRDAPCAKFKTLKAEALVYSKLYDEAQGLANDLLRADSNNVDAVYIKAMCFYYQDMQDKAKRFFTQALKMDPDHSKSRQAMKKNKYLLQRKEEGNLAFKTGDYARAHELYSEALAIDPLNTATNAKLYCNRALAGSKLSRVKEAIADCTEAISLDGNYLRAYQRRATLYQTAEAHEEAVRDCEKVCQLEHSRDNDATLREAKRQLKLSQRKDYYKILGVAKSASGDEIKKAFRKLALKHHPDRHSTAEPQVREAEEKIFKEISSAYSILSDPEKKSRYDSGQDLEEMGMDMDFDPTELFANMFSFGGSPFSSGGGRRGGGGGGPGHFFSFQGGPGGMPFEFS
ncbi:dnaJ homolog subfamily C member 7-like [Halichondria panicea]|uniref:dnaJ homolog subfamily C member 7-like n=1 Tax=Halichondria panicea TaxID=6063 RepID=UPI00312B9401